MSVNIGKSLTDRAGELKDAVGLIEAASGRSLSFSELDNRSDSFAHILRGGGVRPGRRVMLMVKPSADFICLAFALFKIGAPVILIDPGMGYRNLLRCIAGVKPEYFVGIPRAHLFRLAFAKVFASVHKCFCCGSSLGVFGENICKMAEKRHGPYTPYEPEPDDLAAIIFTTGSTGPPKGVRYEHATFYAQLQHIRDYYRIGPGLMDQPAFPLFALFSTALGAGAVIPDMDPTRPAKVNPARFVASIARYGVSYSFGSPALWRVVASHCRARDRRLVSLKKVLMAGAPVSGELLGDMYRVLPADAEIHTPYGATESLPIVSIEGREVVEKTWKLSRQGHGVCVGRSLPGIDIAIIPISDGVISELGADCFLPVAEIGEIIVRGDVVTRAYENCEDENVMAKIPDGDTFWHRMGDVGYLDDEGRLWFCGRRAHRVVSGDGSRTWYSIQCEAIFNVHPDVFRSALVGVYSPAAGGNIPVMVIEPLKKRGVPPSLREELAALGRGSALTMDIDHFLFHPDFPVDIRHNAKIFREKLAVWAVKELEGKL